MTCLGGRTKMTASRIPRASIVVLATHALEGCCLVNWHTRRPILVLLARIIDSCASGREMVRPTGDWALWERGNEGGW